MAENDNNYNGGTPPKGNENGDFWGWLIVVIALVGFWPVGLILLFGKLGEGAGRKYSPRGRHPYDVRQEQQKYWQQQKQQTGQTQQQTGQAQQQTRQTQQQAQKSQPAKAPDPVAKADRSWMTILGTCLAAVGGIGVLS
ncbi:MAG: hypothetical protein RSC82_03575, partial [Oscillospiraceae bacterium]